MKWGCSKETAALFIPLPGLLCSGSCEGRSWNSRLAPASSVRALPARLNGLAHRHKKAAAIQNHTYRSSPVFGSWAGSLAKVLSLEVPESGPALVPAPPCRADGSPPPRPRPWKLSSAHYSHSPSPFPGHTAFREKRADETLWSEHETTLFPVKTFSTSQILGAAVRPTQLAAAPGKPPKEVPHCSSNPPPNNVEWLSLSWVSPCPLCLGDSSRFLRGELLSFWTNIYLHKHL